jgi:hypothetical protein
VLNILSGQFENITFQSWSDAFCAELLYQRPELSPRDFYPRIKRVMEKYGAISPLENALLSVMQNNAGRVVSLLHDFGGFSGAALPATMVSLSSGFSCVVSLQRLLPLTFSFVRLSVNHRRLSCATS